METTEGDYLPHNIGSASQGCQVQHPVFKVGFQLGKAVQAVGSHPILDLWVALNCIELNCVELNRIELN